MPQKGKSNASVARKLGISGQLLGKYIAGTIAPKLNFYQKWKEIYGENLQELIETNVSREIIDMESPIKEIKPNLTQPAYNRFDIKNGGKAEKRIPFYDAPGSAGLVETEMSAIHAPAGTIDVGDLLHDSQAAIRIYGNSMIPNYPPGCVVGLCRVTDSFIEPGEVYVIETIDKRILKRLFYKNDDPDSEVLVCYSDNIMRFEGGARDGKYAYPPFNLPKEEIKNMFMVTGVIKRNANSVIINRGK